MTKKIKLIGGVLFYKGKQYRCIVLATSKKQVAEITGESLSRIQNFFCETQNSAELAVAQGFTSGMWIAPLNSRETTSYIKIK